MKITDKYNEISLSGSIDADVNLINEILKCDGLLRSRIIKVGRQNKKCAVFFSDGMASADSVASDILRSIFTSNFFEEIPVSPDTLMTSVLYSGEVKKSDKLSIMLEGIMYGDTLIIVDGYTEALIVNTKGFRSRGVAEPPDERIEQGPREGFDEVALFNVAAVRRKLQSPDFCSEVIKVGRRSDTLVFMCYMDSLADKRLVKEIKSRIEKIDIDGILDSNYIAESITDSKIGMFKTSGSTERPDVVAARLLEGRVAVIVDGSPVVLTYPYLFSENFQSDEDYYQNYLAATVGRMLRILSFVTATFIPGVFLALICYNMELLPTAFALSVMRLRTGVPLSCITECIILILAFEILKEAGARAPQNSGQALGIVGGLVMGQAAVEARIVSAPMLIAVAVAGVCATAVPRLKTAVFYLRLITVIAAAVLGLYGVIAVATLTLIYVFSLSPFGVDLTAAVSIPYFKNLKDTVIRAPWKRMLTRPLFNKNKKRQKL